MTETVTCVTLTSPKKDLLVAGCHSGNFLLINATSRTKWEQLSRAHYNLIRVIVSLERLKHKWFVSADVCGIIKVWQAIYKVTEAVISFELDGAISYNAVVELTNMLPQHKRNSLFDNSALIAVALKSCKINLVLLFPS